ISMDNAGNFVIVWEDERNGNYDIYSQRYDSTGAAIGTNFIINDDAGTADQYKPSGAMDKRGNFVIVWEDFRNGNWDIYSQRYDSAGSVQGTNFMVNNASTAHQYKPSGAMDKTGNFVIVWYDERNGNSDIYSQRYDNTGTAQGTNFIVNDDAGTASQHEASVSMDKTGNFVITWMDERNSNYDIYSQRYDSTGLAQGTNFIINDDAGVAYQGNPSVSMDKTGNFVIVWDDYRNGNSDIYSQMYDSTGLAQGTNFMVNNVSRAHQYRPSGTMDNAGNFVITWMDERNDNWDIYSQRYDSTGSAQGTNFRVNDDAGTAWQYYPSGAMDNAGNFVIVWQDNRNGNADIYSQRYDSTGAAIGTNFIINDDAGTAGQSEPSISMDNAG
ncbi:hypothetical protein KAU15_02135, partial [candidate division WOR-3 bacterium]|nr:hypothetical protein [candidate division WOR-3 bacterium]